MDIDETKNEMLKLIETEIYKRHRFLKTAAKDIGISYSTLNSMLYKESHNPTFDLILKVMQKMNLPFNITFGE